MQNQIFFFHFHRKRQRQQQTTHKWLQRQFSRFVAGCPARVGLSTSSKQTAATQV